MDSFFCSCSIFLGFIVLSIFQGASTGKFTLVNKCDYTVWPGIFGSPKLDTTGFELLKGSSRSFQAPSGWSGRFWGRTGCNFDSSGHGSCSTADCGSSQLECNGNTATPPATLAEFTLGSGTPDFYDVSLVDGYNLPMFVEVNRGSGQCPSTGCVTDLNRKCPEELRVEGGAACRSACDAFGNPEYCCSGAYNSPSTCKPSTYSEMFKSACPKSYSFAFDDASSTFTCTAADYTITFCPNLSSLKSIKDLSPKTIEGSMESRASEAAGAAVQQAEVATSWLSSLATGDSTRSSSTLSLVQIVIVLVTSLIQCYNNI